MPDLVRNKLRNRLALRRALNKAPAIVVLSKAIRESTIRLGADPTKTRLLYGAVDSQMYDLSAEEAAHVRAEFGLFGQTPLIGMVGQITPWKGWHVLVEAIPAVRARFSNATFLLVGRPTRLQDERYQEGLCARLCEDGQSDAVIWTGFRTDIPAIVTACDVVVHASVEPEPLGMVILEAMAAGRAVICTRGGGTEELVEDQVTGLVVPPGDADALARDLLRCLSQPTLVRDFGEVARTRAAPFSHDRRVAGFVALLDEIASR